MQKNMRFFILKNWGRTLSGAGALINLLLFEYLHETEYDQP